MKEGEEEREEEERWSTALPPHAALGFLMTPAFRVFLHAVFSHFAGRCIFFCQGGSQVWAKEKVGETGRGRAFDMDPPRVSSKC